LLVGVVLDALGGMSRNAWGFSFLAVGILMLATLALFAAMRPRELEGDAGHR
jgi:hypothetical protein